MDQKKIQRIIGIVVVIALVVVVMPLILGKNDLPMENAATNIKAPLPDQAATVASAPTSQDTLSNETSPTTAMAVEATTSSMNTPTPNTEPTSTLNQAADTTLPTPPALSTAQTATTATDTQKPIETTQAADKPAPAPGSIIYEPATTTTPPTVDQPAATEADKPTPIADTTSILPAPESLPKASAIKVKQAVMKEKKSRFKSPTAIQAKATPSKLKSGWAVQMGNFATKKNATHLAKVLRAAGYKTFMQDIKTASGKTHTRVYIGPELKQASATKLSNEVRRHLNMQGYVVSYKL